jgi:hypothetical protein
MNMPTVGMLYVRDIGQIDETQNPLLSDISPDLRFGKHLNGKRLYFIDDGACPVIHIITFNQSFNNCYSQGGGRD